MAVVVIDFLMPDKCIGVCHEQPAFVVHQAVVRRTQGLTSGAWAAYVDKYAEVKEFTFSGFQEL
jgi:hypothetical protein